MSNQKQLREHIIELSRGTTWEAARSEWDLHQIYRTENAQSCPCGQYPIIEICVIKNRVTGNVTEVGNTCINNFLKLPSEKLFVSVRYVREDAGRSFNEEMIDYAYEQRFINDWEYNFYADIRKKRRLSGKQKEKKEAVNNKILARITR